MRSKYWFLLVLVVAVVGLVGFVTTRIDRGADTTGVVLAGSPSDGVEVPGTNGKIRAFDGGTFHVQPSAFAVSEAVRDMPELDEKSAEYYAQNPSGRIRRKQAKEQRIAQERIDKGLPPITEEEKVEYEINERNAKAIKKIDPNVAPDEDPLVRRAESFDSIEPKAMPTPNLTFEGANSTEAFAIAGGGFSPPDTTGDVGPNHYFAAINVVFKIYNKNGTVAKPAFAANQLWASLPANDPCRVDNDGDPIVLYDQLADRWHVSQFAITSGLYQCVAVSVTNDPTGSFYVWSYQYPGGLFNDYPKIGVWPDAYHMTFNQFNAAGTTFLGLGFLSQDRPKALAGDPTASVVYRNIATIDPDAGGALPLDVEGFVPPPAGMPVVIGEFRATEFGDPLDAIRFYKWQPNFTSPGSSTVTVLTDVGLAAFDARNPQGLGDVEVQGGALLDSISDRLMHRLVYRNLGTVDAPVNSIVGGFVVNTSGLTPNPAATPTPPTTRANLYDAGIRWFELRRNGDSFTVFDQGTHADPGTSPSPTPSPGQRLNNWMPSISQDNQGNLGLGYSQAGPNQNADIKIAGRTNNAGNAGVMNEGEVLFFDATGAQQSTGGRWGDYSTMSVDPTDDCTFWYTQEYYASNSTVGWTTRIGSFKFPSCNAAPKGTISGTITACTDGSPINQANVNASGGFHRLSAANGTYSMEVAPGNYNVSADKAPGFIGAGQNVSVTAGNTSNVNICLNGVPILSGGTVSIVAESCGLPNQLPDPGETLSVSLPIVNNGGAPTTNLTATLRTSGGAISTGPPQNYGAIPIGGGSVSRNFTFRMQPGLSCGATVTLTWDIQDGASNLGTIVKTLSSGSPVINLAENFDGATPPALPAGWTELDTSGTAINWVTQASTADSAPNSAFAATVTTTNASALVSPSINISSPSASVTFRNNFNLEASSVTPTLGYDGMVLEIKIGAGSWQDIVAAGGSFTAGGYTRTISTGFSSPIAGRNAWSGNSSGYITSTANLPASANGQSIQLRWLVASDSSANAVGARIDSIQVIGGVSCQGPCAPPKAVRADFDGDGLTDPSVYRSSDGAWYALGSTEGFLAAYWGVSTDSPLGGDFSGDGTADLVVRRNSGGNTTIYVLFTDTFTYTGINWGVPGDTITIGDYNPGGGDEVAAYRPGDAGFWVLDTKNPSSWRFLPFGAAGDLPLSGDFDGDGRAELAVYRPSEGNWYWATQDGPTIGPLQVIRWGVAEDKPVHADYDGDEVDDIAVFRPSNGTWYILRSSDGQGMYIQWGVSTDTPVPGDYDGDGSYDLAIFRGGTWWIRRTADGSYYAVNWGVSADTPIPSKYLP